MRTAWRVAVSSLVVVGVTAGSYAVGAVSDRVGRDDNFVIDSFDQRVTIDDTGDTRVVETIDVTFVTSRRGIFRDFDEQSEFPSTGGFGEIAVDQGDVSRPWTHTLESGPTGPRVRIGDAAVLLDPGPYTYRLSYAAPSWYYALADDPDVVEVRIDAPGYDWPTTIGTATITVELPGTVRSATCVEGPRRTTRPCARSPIIDADEARFHLGPFAPRESATIAIQMDRSAIAGDVPTFDATPLGTRRLLDPWNLDPRVAALVLALLLILPLLAWEALSAWMLYRDRMTDPALHDRLHPPLPAPPGGLRPPEVAGLLLRRDADAMLLATIVDLDQRGALVTTSKPGTKRFGKIRDETLTIAPARSGPTPDHRDTAFVSALVPSGTTTTFDGDYDATVAERASAAKSLLSDRASRVFEEQGFTHHEAGLVGQRWFRALVVITYVILASALALVSTRLTPLHPGASAGVVGLVLAGWAIAHIPWRHHRVPLNSAGRDAIAQARAFREFLATVEGEQIEWASGRPGIDHHHPALSLLPYAIVLGLADSWYDRFGSLMRELALAGGLATTAAGTVWWADQRSFDHVSSSHAGTSTAPSSSGGSGGGGSGGGGGGGGSW